MRSFVKLTHWSDCAVYNAPALPVGECDCGAIANSKSVCSLLYHETYIRAVDLKMFLREFALIRFRQLEAVSIRVVRLICSLRRLDKREKIRDRAD